MENADRPDGVSNIKRTKPKNGGIAALRRILKSRVLIAATAFAGGAYAGLNNPLPVPDRGGWAFMVPDRDAQRTLIEILQHFGKEPQFELKGYEGGTRVVMKDPGTLIAVLSPEARKQIGENVGSSITFSSANPMRDADWVKVYLAQNGHEAEIFENVDHINVPAGWMAIVKCPEVFGDMVLAFRRPILDLMLHFGKPEPYIP